MVIVYCHWGKFPGGILPYIGYTGMCHWKGYGNCLLPLGEIPGGYSHILAIWVCATGKGMVIVYATGVNYECDL